MTESGAQRAGETEAVERAAVRLRTGASIGVLERGAGPAPPLVVVPGVGGAKELFATLLPELARGRRVLALDLSPRVARGAGVVASAVDDLLETLDALSVPRADLLGQSFGALVAVGAWRRSPDRVRRLVLAAPATAPSGIAGLRVVLKWAALGSATRLWPRQRRHSLARFVRRAGGYAIEPEVEGADFDALVDRVKAARLRPLLRRMLALAGHSWVREMADVRAPVLVIEGESETAVLPPAVVACFRAHPTTRWAAVRGGHMPFVVRPREFAGAVLAFLDAPEGAPHS